MNNTDPISRSEVLEALNNARETGDDYEIGKGIYLAVEIIKSLPSVSVSQPPETSLEKESEDFGDALYDIGVCVRIEAMGSYEGPTFSAEFADYQGTGITPLEAVLKLKEALNSNP